jgi:hypothetical protein
MGLILIKKSASIISYNYSKKSFTFLSIYDNKGYKRTGDRTSMGRGLYMLGQGRPHKPFHRVRFSVEFSSLDKHSSGVPSCETGSAVPRRLNRQSQTIREGGAENHGSLNPGVESMSGYYLIW